MTLDSANWINSLIVFYRRLWISYIHCVVPEGPQGHPRAQGHMGGFRGPACCSIRDESKSAEGAGVWAAPPGSGRRGGSGPRTTRCRRCQGQLIRDSAPRAFSEGLSRTQLLRIFGAQTQKEGRCPAETLSFLQCHHGSGTTVTAAGHPAASHPQRPRGVLPSDGPSGEARQLS